MNLRSYIDNKRLVIHNADFDLSHINNELKILPARIEEAIEKQFWTEEEYPSLERVTEKATLLRASLVEVIEGLQNAKNDLGEDEEYKELRVQIRHYLKNQLAREAKWSTEALQGLRR